MSTPPCAGFVSRAAAFAVDAAAATVLCTAGYLFGRLVLAALGIDLGTTDGARGYLVALPFVFGAYCVAFWSLVGRTPGMTALGLRVVTLDGRPPGVRRSVVRALGYWVSAIAMLGFAWVVIDPRRQGFHDKLARTLVLYDVEAVAS